MCNEIAYQVWVDHGERSFWTPPPRFAFETGGPAALSGAMTRTVAGDLRFTAEQMVAAIRPASRHAPRTALVSVENTANMGGGAVWPLAQLQAVGRAARAWVAAAWMARCSTRWSPRASAPPISRRPARVWIDCRGLGLSGRRGVGGRRRFHRQGGAEHQFGGAMRQAGIIAAAGVHALKHVDRLAEDHANAQTLAQGLAGIDGLDLDPATVETNMVYFDVAKTGLTGAEFSAALRPHGAQRDRAQPSCGRSRISTSTAR